MRGARCAFLGVLVVVTLAAGVSTASAAFPGRNGRIAFSTDFVKRPQIYTIRPDGTKRRKLTHLTKGHSAVEPDMSPGGGRIAFVKRACPGGEEGCASGHIWAISANGGDKRRLTHKAGFEDRDPSWSPNGKRIVFSRCEVSLGFESYCDIDVMRANGTGVRKLLGGHWLNLHPEYSPDGNRIAFAGTRGGYTSAVWIMEANGGRPRRLTNPGLEAAGPDWAPDGSRIVFGSHTELPKSDIWVMHADGSHQHKLTHMPKRGDAPVARYSPDGRRIALLTNLSHPKVCCWDIFEMRANGSRLRPTPNSVPGVASLDWGPRAGSKTAGTR